MNDIMYSNQCLMKIKPVVMGRTLFNHSDDDSKLFYAMYLATHNLISNGNIVCESHQNNLK